MKTYLPVNLTYSLEEEIFNIAYDIELEYDVIFGIIVYSSNFWFSQKANTMPLFSTYTGRRENYMKYFANNISPF